MRQLKLEEKLNPEEEKLLEIIRDVGWGEIKNIQVKNGKPVMLQVQKDIKLNLND